MDCSPPGSSVYAGSPGKYTGVDCHPHPVDLPNPGIELRSPALQVDSLPSEPPGKDYLVIKDDKINILTFKIFNEYRVSLSPEL